MIFKNTLKSALNHTLGDYFTKYDSIIIVNSYGRSGSTVLTNSLIDSMSHIDNPFLKKIKYYSIYGHAWDLNNKNLRLGRIYKTHDYPPEKTFQENTKIIYTFGNPVDVIISLIRLYKVRGEEWLKRHYNHLKVPYTGIDAIIEKDDLQLEKHFDSWLQEKRFSIAFVKYEEMWNYQKEISNYLGLEINLPPFKKRKARSIDIVEKETIKKIEKNYSSFSNKVDSHEGFFIVN